MAVMFLNILKANVNNRNAYSKTLTKNSIFLFNSTPYNCLLALRNVSEKDHYK